jgi:hypothetical protein
MLKKLVVASAMTAVAFLTPALAQVPETTAPAAEANQAAPAKAAPKKHKHKKPAAKKAKAKSDSTDPKRPAATRSNKVVFSAVKTTGS